MILSCPVLHIGVVCYENNKVITDTISDDNGRSRNTEEYQSPSLRAKSLVGEEQTENNCHYEITDATAGLDNMEVSGRQREKVAVP